MEKLLKEALSKFKQAEVYLIEEESLPVHFDNNQVSRINGKKTLGVTLRVIDREGRLGIASATSLERSDLIERAALSAQYGDKAGFEFPNEEAKMVQCYDPLLADLTAKEIVDQGKMMIDIITSIDRTLQCDLNLAKDVFRVKIMNSSGLDVAFDRTNFTITLVSRADDGFREITDWDTYANHFIFDQERLERFVYNHQWGRKRFKAKTGKMDIIFTPGTVWALLLRVFAGVNGANVNRGISPLKGRLGEEICSPLINIVDDPTFAYGFASTPYDDEGTVAKVTSIIENGILKNYIFDLDSAAGYGTTSTGNGFKRNLFTKGIDHKPETNPTNMILLPGKNTYEEMVKSIEHGIVVNQIMGGHTGNIQAGEFGLNIGNGLLVENGEIKGKVMDAMVSGNVYDVLKKVTMVGNKLRATQAVFFGYGYTPAILVPDLVVAGSKS